MPSTVLNALKKGMSTQMQLKNNPSAMQIETELIKKILSIRLLTMRVVLMWMEIVASIRQASSPNTVKKRHRSVGSRGKSRSLADS